MKSSSLIKTWWEIKSTVNLNATLFPISPSSGSDNSNTKSSLNLWLKRNKASAKRKPQSMPSILIYKQIISAGIINNIKKPLL